MAGAIALIGIVASGSKNPMQLSKPAVSPAGYHGAEAT